MIDLSKVHVKDVMTADTVSVSREDRISEIIAKMSDEGTHELPVVAGQNVVGIVTYSTLLRKKNLPLTANADVVMQHFPQLSPLDPLVKGIEIMINSGLRDLPVVKNNKLAGTVYRKDLLKTLAKVRGLRSRRTDEIMTPKPEVVRDIDDVRKALSIMRGLDEKNLPVLDDQNRLIGVIGMMDIMKTTWKPKKSQKKEMSPGKRPVEVLVGSIMNKPAISVDPDSPLEEAIRAMIRKDISTVFVTENSDLVGVITLKDVLEQALSLEEGKKGVYVQLTGLEIEDPDVYDSLYSVIQKGMIRIAKFSSPRIFNAHVATYHHEGFRSKYSIHARLTTDHGMFFSKTSEWDLFRAMHNSLEGLEKEIKKNREIDLTKRRKKKRK